MNLERLAKDLAYWEAIDPSGGEATHYSPTSTYPWLREEPLGFFLDDGVWGKYGDQLAWVGLLAASPRKALYLFWKSTVTRTRQ